MCFLAAEGFALNEEHVQLLMECKHNDIIDIFETHLPKIKYL